MKTIDKAIANLRESRFKFSPEEIFNKGEFKKRGKLIIIDKNSIIKTKKDNILFINALNSIFKLNIVNYTPITICYFVADGNIHCGVYNINDDKVIKEICIINKSNPLEAINDSGYIYSHNSKFYIELNKIISE